MNYPDYWQAVASGERRLAGYMPGWRSGRGLVRMGGSRGARRRRTESVWGHITPDVQSALWRAREVNRILCPAIGGGLFLVDGRRVVRPPQRAGRYRSSFYTSARGQAWRRFDGHWTRRRS